MGICFLLGIAMPLYISGIACTCLISYAPYPGNSKTLLEYAKRRTKEITVIDLSTC